MTDDDMDARFDIARQLAGRCNNCYRKLPGVVGCSVNGPGWNWATPNLGPFCDSCFGNLLLSETKEPQPDGCALIAAERRRQQTVESWTPEHDDEHAEGEMGQAAICYIDDAAPNDWESHPYWPWEARWWKPSPDPIRNLVKAGALIAAEIDRLARASRVHVSETKESQPPECHGPMQLVYTQHRCKICGSVDELTAMPRVQANETDND